MDKRDDMKTADQCFEMFEKSGKIGYYMLYNALKEQEKE